MVKMSKIGTAILRFPGTAADTITGTASHLNFSNSCRWAKRRGNGAHDASTDWYNSSMIGTDVEGLSESSIAEQLDANGAGLGDYSIEISVSAAGDPAQSNRLSKRRQGEDVSYTIQLIVLDYTIIPFVDIENI